MCGTCIDTGCPGQTVTVPAPATTRSDICPALPMAHIPDAPDGWRLLHHSPDALP